MPPLSYRPGYFPVLGTPLPKDLTGHQPIEFTTKKLQTEQHPFPHQQPATSDQQRDIFHPAINVDADPEDKYRALDWQHMSQRRFGETENELGTGARSSSADFKKKPRQDTMAMASDTDAFDQRIIDTFQNASLTRHHLTDEEVAEFRHAYGSGKSLDELSFIYEQMVTGKITHPSIIDVTGTEVPGLRAVVFKGQYGDSYKRYLRLFLFALQGDQSNMLVTGAFSSDKHGQDYNDLHVALTDKKELPEQLKLRIAEKYLSTVQTGSTKFHRGQWHSSLMRDNKNVLNLFDGDTIVTILYSSRYKEKRVGVFVETLFHDTVPLVVGVAKPAVSYPRVVDLQPVTTTPSPIKTFLNISGLALVENTKEDIGLRISNKDSLGIRTVFVYSPAKISVSDAYHILKSGIKYHQFMQETADGNLVAINTDDPIRELRRMGSSFKVSLSKPLPPMDKVDEEKFLSILERESVAGEIYKSPPMGNGWINNGQIKQSITLGKNRLSFDINFRKTPTGNTFSTPTNIEHWTMQNGQWVRSDQMITSKFEKYDDTFACVVMNFRAGPYRIFMGTNGIEHFALVRELDTAAMAAAANANTSGNGNTTPNTSIHNKVLFEPKPIRNIPLRLPDSYQGRRTITAANAPLRIDANFDSQNLKTFIHQSTGGKKEITLYFGPKGSPCRYTAHSYKSGKNITLTPREHESILPTLVLEPGNNKLRAPNNGRLTLIEHLAFGPKLTNSVFHDETTSTGEMRDDFTGDWTGFFKNLTVDAELPRGSQIELESGAEPQDHSYVIKLQPEFFQNKTLEAELEAYIDKLDTQSRLRLADYRATAAKEASLVLPEVAATQDANPTPSLTPEPETEPTSPTRPTPPAAKPTATPTTEPVAPNHWLTDGMQPIPENFMWLDKIPSHHRAVIPVNVDGREVKMIPFMLKTKVPNQPAVYDFRIFVISEGRIKIASFGFFVNGDPLRNQDKTFDMLYRHVKQQKQKMNSSQLRTALAKTEKIFSLKEDGVIHQGLGRELTFINGRVKSFESWENLIQRNLAANPSLSHQQIVKGLTKQKDLLRLQTGVGSTVFFDPAAPLPVPKAAAVTPTQTQPDNTAPTGGNVEPPNNIDNTSNTGSENPPPPQAPKFSIPLSAADKTLLRDVIRPAWMIAAASAVPVKIASHPIQIDAGEYLRFAPGEILIASPDTLKWLKANCKVNDDGDEFLDLVPMRRLYWYELKSTSGNITLRIPVRYNPGRKKNPFFVDTSVTPEAYISFAKQSTTIKLTDDRFVVKNAKDGSIEIFMLDGSFDDERIKDFHFKTTSSKDSSIVLGAGNALDSDGSRVDEALLREDIKNALDVTTVAVLGHDVSDMPKAQYIKPVLSFKSDKDVRLTFFSGLEGNRVEPIEAHLDGLSFDGDNLVSDNQQLTLTFDAPQAQGSPLLEKIAVTINPTGTENVFALTEMVQTENGNEPSATEAPTIKRLYLWNKSLGMIWQPTGIDLKSLEGNAAQILKDLHFPATPTPATRGGYGARSRHLDSDSLVHIDERIPYLPTKYSSVPVGHVVNEAPSNALIDDAIINAHSKLFLPDEETVHIMLIGGRLREVATFVAPDGSMLILPLEVNPANKSWYRLIKQHKDAATFGAQLLLADPNKPGEFILVPAKVYGDGSQIHVITQTNAVLSLDMASTQANANKRRLSGFVAGLPKVKTENATADVRAALYEQTDFYGLDAAQATTNLANNERFILGREIILKDGRELILTVFKDETNGRLTFTGFNIDEANNRATIEYMNTDGSVGEMEVHRAQNDGALYYLIDGKQIHTLEIDDNGQPLILKRPQGIETFLIPKPSPKHVMINAQGHVYQSKAKSPATRREISEPDTWPRIFEIATDLGRSSGTGGNTLSSDIDTQDARVKIEIGINEAGIWGIRSAKIKTEGKEQKWQDAEHAIEHYGPGNKSLRLRVKGSERRESGHGHEFFDFAWLDFVGHEDLFGENFGVRASYYNMKNTHLNAMPSNPQFGKTDNHTAMQWSAMIFGDTKGPSLMDRILRTASDIGYFIGSVKDPAALEEIFLLENPNEAVPAVHQAIKWLEKTKRRRGAPAANTVTTPTPTP